MISSIFVTLLLLSKFNEVTSVSPKLVKAVLKAFWSVVKYELADVFFASIFAFFDALRVAISSKILAFWASDAV
jgi:hypothetical protein